METLKVVINGVTYVPENKESVKEDNSTPPFKVWDWVIGREGNHPLEPRRVLEIGEETVSYSEDNNRIISNAMFISCLRLCTREEVRVYLMAEAKRRGFSEGTMYHYPNYSHLGTRTCLGEFYVDSNYKIVFEDSGYIIFDTDGWAEIITEPRPLPKTVEELRIFVDEWDMSDRNWDRIADQFK